VAGTVDIGRVGIWTASLDSVPSAEARRLAGRIEALGFPTLWLPEVAGRDPFVTSALLLSATDELRLATGIATIYGRDAVTMANVQRTLDEAFPGRFLLGIGVSHQQVVEGIRHHDYSKPYSRMVEYLGAMDQALFMAVGPQERPATVLAALGPKMLRLAAERAQGAHTYLVPPEHTVEARALLGPDAMLAVEQMVVLDTDQDRGLATARNSISFYLQAPNYTNNLRRLGFTDDDIAGGGSDRLVEAIVAVGDASTAVSRVQAHLDAGASHVCVQVLGESLISVPEAGWEDLAAALRSADLLS
jgi:probable F420-dependent oxidoreductase